MRFVRGCWASCVVLALTLALPVLARAAPSTGDAEGLADPPRPEPQPSTPVQRSAPGTQVIAEDGTLVARVVERDGVATRLDLPKGRYRLVAPDGTTRTVEVPSSGVLVLGDAKAEPAGTAPATTPATEADKAPGPSPATPRSRRAPRRWTRWGAPLLATFVPGLGHVVAGRPGAGVGIFAGAGGLLFASIALGRAGDRREGAAFGDRGRSAVRESLRQIAFIGATDTLALLWLGQIADAWVVATGKRVQGKRDHVVSLAFVRASAVGMRPGEPAIARYDDWTVQLLGQVAPRIMIGLSDLGLRLGANGRVTVQGGAKIAVRAVQLSRFWLVPTFAVIIQGTSARTQTPEKEGAPPRERNRLGVVPYLQLEGRIFVLDRLSLDIAPRLSVPLGHRVYGGDSAIPRFAPTFELAAGPTVYF